MMKKLFATLMMIAAVYTANAQCDNGLYNQYFRLLDQQVRTNSSGSQYLRQGGNNCDIVVWVLDVGTMGDIATATAWQIERFIGSRTITTLRTYNVRRIVFVSNNSTLTRIFNF